MSIIETLLIQPTGFSTGNFIHSMGEDDHQERLQDEQLDGKLSEDVVNDCVTTDSGIRMTDSSNPECESNTSNSVSELLSESRKFLSIAQKSQHSSHSIPKSLSTPSELNIGDEMLPVSAGHVSDSKSSSGQLVLSENEDKVSSRHDHIISQKSLHRLKSGTTSDDFLAANIGDTTKTVGDHLSNSDINLQASLTKSIIPRSNTNSSHHSNAKLSDIDHQTSFNSSSNSVNGSPDVLISRKKSSHQSMTSQTSNSHVYPNQSDLEDNLDSPILQSMSRPNISHLSLRSRAISRQSIAKTESSMSGRGQVGLIDSGSGSKIRGLSIENPSQLNTSSLTEQGSELRQWRNVEGLVKKSPLGGKKSPLRGAPVSRVYLEQFVKKRPKNLNK